MNAIFKVNNVYVGVRYKDFREGIEVDELEDLIIYSGGPDLNLYGGRVRLKEGSGMFDIYIDGIRIEDISLNSEGRFYNSSYSYDVEQIVSYLNQIENLGLETFLENYKKQLENLKEKLEGISTEIQQNLQTENDKRLAIIHGSIMKIHSFLFPLYVNLNAGIETQDYTDAYNTIVNKYF